MGKPDRQSAESSDQIDGDVELNLNTDRFLSLREALHAYRLSNSQHRDTSPTDGSRPDDHRIPPPAIQALTSTTCDRLERDVASALAELTQDAASRGLGAPPQPMQNEIRRPTQVAARHRHRWTAWIPSIVAAMLAAASWVGFIAWLHIRPASSQMTQIGPDVASDLSTGGPTDAAGSPDHAEMIVQDQKGLVNEPVPIGISLRRGSGREVVTLDNLVEGTQLSLGTSLSATRWSLPAKDLDSAFIGAPRDFSGTMEVTARLYSPGNDLLQTKVIRPEWDARPIDKPSATIPPRANANPEPLIETTNSIPPPAASHARTSTDNGWPPVADPKPPAKAATLPWPQISPSQTKMAPATKSSRPAGEVDALLRTGERLLREGDVAGARPSLRRAAEAESAEAARALGMSFDPSFLRRIGASAAPDPAQAAQWYRRAIELGLKDVSRDLDRLARTPNVRTH